jgi:hypothetical protein
MLRKQNISGTVAGKDISCIPDNSYLQNATNLAFCKLSGINPK